MSDIILASIWFACIYVGAVYVFPVIADRLRLSLLGEIVALGAVVGAVSLAFCAALMAVSCT